MGPSKQMQPVTQGGVDKYVIEIVAPCVSVANPKRHITFELTLMEYTFAA